ncbi:MAG: hypothetical protein JKY54_19765, partial [Flavobacteriales bacterium]|nr:hypothetical protein [Flavobacteriales bacterium]
SAVFRRGGDVSFVSEELKSIMDPKGGEWIEGRYIPSYIALLGSIVQEHLDHLKLQGLDYVTVPATQVEPIDVGQTTQVYAYTPSPVQCPECNSFNVDTSQACPVCLDCGSSKCG